LFFRSLSFGCAAGLARPGYPSRGRPPLRREDGRARAVRGVAGLAAGREGPELDNAEPGGGRPAGAGSGQDCSTAVVWLLCVSARGGLPAVGWFEKWWRRVWSLNPVGSLMVEPTPTTRTSTGAEKDDWCIYGVVQEMPIQQRSCLTCVQPALLVVVFRFFWPTVLWARATLQERVLSAQNFRLLSG